jgi:hypothetical protein
MIEVLYVLIYFVDDASPAINRNVLEAQDAPAGHPCLRVPPALQHLVLAVHTQVAQVRLPRSEFPGVSPPWHCSLGTVSVVL